ncbi:hypothetical protein SDC9_108082 [bioreactor metagenome]|uniref:Uncharacterized protein n=1 Tax=bioreactor metagenome TaxID=1076179 RepID=A0A645B719_9ZZZZ
MIQLSYLMFTYQFRETALRGARERDYHCAGGVPVKPLHRRGPVVAAGPAKFRKRSRDKRVAAFDIGLREQPGRLIYDPETAVPVKRLKRRPFFGNISLMDIVAVS